MGKNFNCPHCGGHLTIGMAGVPPHIISGHSSKSRTYQSSVKTALPQVASTMPIDDPTQDWQRVTPVGRLTPVDVTTSIYDGLISFLLVTLGLSGLLWYTDMPLVVAPATGFAVACWRYFGGMRLAKSLLEMIETLSERKEAEPVEQQIKHTLSVETKTESGKRWQFADLPGQPAALQEFAQRVIEDIGTFSERTAVKCKMTQDEYSDLSDIFVDRFWAIRRHQTLKRLGVNLTQNGKSVLRAIASSTIPSPESFDGTHAAASKHKSGDFFM